LLLVFESRKERKREREREREKALLITTGDERREGGKEGSGELCRSSNSNSSSFIIDCGYLQMQSS
jgi:hypothetical protein